MREAQRARILDAVVGVVAERGVAGASVERVIARAGVSRRTFYEHFGGGVGECLIAVSDDGLVQVGMLAARAFEENREDGGFWWDGMRGALAGVLSLFDRERDLARVLMVEVFAAGPAVREHALDAIGAFRALVVERIEGEVSHPSPLAPESVLASVMDIVRARLMTGDGQQPLIALLGPLMGVIVGAFVDRDRVAREIELGEELARTMLGRCSPSDRRVGADNVREVLVPAVLRDPRAHRARACLRYVVARPGVSNRRVGDGIGVAHRGQVSALLAMLCDLGLLDRRSGGLGRANSWRATPMGEIVADALWDVNGDASGWGCDYLE